MIGVSIVCVLPLPSCLLLGKACKFFCRASFRRLAEERIEKKQGMEAGGRRLTQHPGRGEHTTRIVLAWQSQTPNPKTCTPARSQANPRGRLLHPPATLSNWPPRTF